ALSSGAHRSDRSSVRLAASRVRFSCEQVKEVASLAASCCVARFAGCRTVVRFVLAFRRRLIVMRYMPPNEFTALDAAMAPLFGSRWGLHPVRGSTHSTSR